MSDPSGQQAAPPPRPPFPTAPPVERRFGRAGARAILGLAAMAFVGPRALAWAGERLCAHVCGCDAFDDSPWWLRINLVRVAVQFLAAIGVLGLGLRAVRGRRVPLWLAGVLALAPLVVGLVEARWLEREMQAILSGTSAAFVWSRDDFSAMVNDVAHVFLELSDALHVAAFSAGIAMLGVAGAACADLFTIDASKVGPLPGWAVFRGARSDSLPTTRDEETRLRRDTCAVGIAAAAAWALARFAVPTRVVWFDVLAGLLITASIPVATLAGRPLPSLVAHRNERDAGDAFRTLALCALTYTSAALLLVAPVLVLELRASVAEGAVMSCGHEAIAAPPAPGPWVAPPAFGDRALLVGIGALASAAAFVPGLLAGARARAKRPLGALVLAACLGTMAVLGHAVVARVVDHVAEGHAPYRRSEQAMARARVVLPISHGNTTDRAYPARWILAPDGLVDACDGLEGACGHLADRRKLYDMGSPREDFPDDVAVHEGVPFARMVRVLLQALPARRDGALPIRLVAAPASRRPVERFGALAGLFRTDLVAHEILLNDTLADLRPYTRDPLSGRVPPGDDYGVLPGADGARVFVFLRTGPRSIAVTEMGPTIALVPFAGVHTELWWSTGRRMVVAPMPGATAGGIYVVLDALGPWLPGGVVFTEDRAPFEEAVAAWDAAHR